MFYKTIQQYVQVLRNLEHWLDFAKKHANAKNFDMIVLLQARLAPDQANLIYQVTSACDHAKGAAALLAGRTPPKHADTEKTVTEVRERISMTVAYIETMTESDYDDAAKRPIAVSWSPPDTVISGEDYLVQVSLPNVYFHLMVAYEILRHNGVDLGRWTVVAQLDG